MTILKVPTLDDAYKIKDKHLPTRLQDATLTATIATATAGKANAADVVPKWKPNTVYAIGDLTVQSGDVKVSLTNHTSGPVSPGTLNWTDPPTISAGSTARTRNEVRRRAATRRAKGGVVSRVAFPAGFGWAAPINIFKTGKTYTTGFDVARYKNTGGGTYYVDTVNGVDTNAGTTEAAPVKSLLKAYQLAAAGSTIMILDRGIIYRAGSWSGTRIQKSVNIIAKYPGEPIVAYADALTYTLTSGQTEVYETTRSNVEKVIDLTVGRHGYEYQKLTSTAAVAAQPGSWWQNGTTLVVHTLTGAAPDNTKQIALLAGETWYANSDTAAVSLYLEGFHILGGYNGLVVDSTNNTIDVYGKNMTFNWATGAYNAVNIQGGRYAYFQNCIAVNSRKDGFNYTTNNLAVVAKDTPRFIEVNCEGYAHGIKNDIAGAENTNNGSTAHLGAKGVRIGGTYHDTTGAPLADVHVGTQSLNYSCVSYDSLSADINFNQAFSAQQAGAEMWAFDCQFFGTTSDVYALTGATVHLDSCEYDTKNGGGTFDITNAL